MASDNSDSEDSLSNLQLTDNIKTENRSESVSSTGSAEELSLSDNKSPNKSESVSRTNSTEELSLSDSKSPIRDLSTSNSKSLPAQVNKSLSKLQPKPVSTGSTSSLSPNLQHYISKYDSHYIPQSGAAKALEEIESDEEVFIVQTTKDFNLKEFIDKKLNIEKTNQLEMSDGITLEYYVENFHKKPNLSLIFGEKPDGAMKVNTFKPEGKIIIREKLFIGEKTVENNALQLENPKKVPFPRDLRIRHPLLGAFYEDKINLPKKVVKQLQRSRKMKKIKTEFSNDNAGIKMEESFDFMEAIDEEQSPKKHKKSKKLKRERSIELEVDNVDNVEETNIKRSPKKKKVKLEKFDDENELSWISQI